MRWRRRATAKAPEPTPSSGRSSKTLKASRQYFPREDDAAKTRPPLSSGATFVSLVSSSMRSPMPRSLKATDVNATSGTMHATATVAMPIRRRIRAVGTRRAAVASIAAPTSSSSASMSSTSAPNSPATSCLAASGWRLFENGSFESAQAATAPAAAVGNNRTGRLRSRSGTSANQPSAPTSAAAAAPRDCVSRIARTNPPIAG